MLTVVVCLVCNIYWEIFHLKSIVKYIRHSFQIENSDIVNNRLIRKLQAQIIISLKIKFLLLVKQPPEEKQLATGRRHEVAEEPGS